MIKIEFSGLTFFPATGFTNVTALLNRLIPIDDLVTNVSVEWNGKTSIVQSIFYDAFQLSFICKETEKQDFQKVAYAPKIEVIDTDISKTIQAKFIDVAFEKINDNQEFYICKFSFSDIATKNVQNNHDNLEYLTKYQVKFDYQPGSSSLTINTSFEPIIKYNYSENVKNDYKDKIVDFNKKSKIYRALFFRTESELADLFNVLGYVSKPVNMYKLRLYNYNTSSDIVSDVSQFNLITNELIGNGLYKIELELITENVIRTPYNGF